ncbi:MAG: hypothetical protein P1U40_07335 [Coxiellaceae bacterium]|nr:hypothetical protein [Coxiellaceae bacterium]
MSGSSRSNRDLSNARSRGRSRTPRRRREPAGDVFGETHGSHNMSDASAFIFMGSVFVFSLAAMNSVLSAGQLMFGADTSKGSTVGLSLTMAYNILLTFTAGLVLQSTRQALAKVDMSVISPLAQDSLTSYAPVAAVLLPICFQTNQFAYDQPYRAIASCVVMTSITFGLIRDVKNTLCRNTETLAGNSLFENIKAQSVGDDVDADPAAYVADKQLENGGVLSPHQ